LDSDIGLYDYGTRFYDPVVARFLSADHLYVEQPTKKLDNPQSLNTYAYVLNNPLKYTDPDGQDAESIRFFDADLEAGVSVDKNLEPNIGISGEVFAAKMEFATETNDSSGIFGAGVGLTIRAAAAETNVGYDVKSKSLKTEIGVELASAEVCGTACAVVCLSLCGSAGIGLNAEASIGQETKAGVTLGGAGVKAAVSIEPERIQALGRVINNGIDALKQSLVKLNAWRLRATPP
jgi:RHS repeat-associated protein